MILTIASGDLAIAITIVSGDLETAQDVVEAQAELLRHALAEEGIEAVVEIADDDGPAPRIALKALPSNDD